MRTTEDAGIYRFEPETSDEKKELEDLALRWKRRVVTTALSPAIRSRPSALDHETASTA